MLWDALPNCIRRSTSSLCFQRVRAKLRIVSPYSILPGPFVKFRGLSLERMQTPGVSWTPIAVLWPCGLRQNRHETFCSGSNLVLCPMKQAIPFLRLLSFEEHRRRGSDSQSSVCPQGIFGETHTRIVARLRHQGVSVRSGRRCIRRKRKPSLYERVRDKELPSQDGVRSGFSELGLSCCISRFVH